MKIFFSTYDSSGNPYYGGGGAVLIEKIAKKLAEKNDVTIIAGAYPGSSNELIKDRVRYKFISSSKIGPKFGQLLFFFLLPFYAFRQKFDLWIENFTPPFSTGFIPFFTRNPVIGVCHFLDAEAKSKEYHLPFTMLQNFGLKQYKHFIALTEEQKRKIKLINPFANIEIIPNATDIKPLENIIKKTDSYILYLGRIEINQKGLDLLIASFEKINKKDLTLIIAGSGRRKDVQVLEKLISQSSAKSRIKFIGKTKGKEKINLLMNAICLVVPSRFEEQTLSVIEAIVLGTPIVSFNIDGLKWLSSEISLKSPAFNLYRFRKNIELITKNPSIRRKMSYECIKIAKKFDMKTLISRYENYIYSFNQNNKNILLTHVYSSKNKGDAAITSVMINQIKRKFPESNITLSSMDNSYLHNEFEETRTITSFFYEAVYRNKSVFKRFLLTLYVLIIPIFWSLVNFYLKINLRFLLSKNINNLLKEIKRTDLVIGVGGAYLMGSNNVEGTITLLLHLLNIVVAKIFHKPYILYSQSIGPFTNKFQVFLVRTILNKVDWIIAREKISIEYLIRIGIKKAIIFYSPDAAVLLQNKHQTQMKMLLKKHKVNNKYPITMITVKRLHSSISTYYEEILAKFLDKVIDSTNHQIVFIPQSTSILHNDDDRKVMKRIKKEMKNGGKVVLIEQELDHYQIKSLYSLANYLIATRMHSAIFSMTNYVPTMAIAYEHKTIGVMNDLGLKKWVIPLNEINDLKLMKMFLSLQNNRTRYLKILKKTMPLYIKKALETMTYIEKKMVQRGVSL